MSDNQTGARDPRPVVSTTRSASNSSSTLSSAHRRTRTPVIRPPPSTRPITSQWSMKPTPGSELTRRRRWCSSTSRLALTRVNPLGAGRKRWLVSLSRRSASGSPTGTPSAARSWVSPGSSCSIACCPPASSPWMCLALGNAPTRLGTIRSLSRSTTMTVVNRSASTRAASSPARLPPSTTAQSPRVRFIAATSYLKAAARHRSITSPIDAHS